VAQNDESESPDVEPASPPREPAPTDNDWLKMETIRGGKYPPRPKPEPEPER
jgi:hypothetical protein